MIQQREENDCRNYFMINFHESMGQFVESIGKTFDKSCLTAQPIPSQFSSGYKYPSCQTWQELFLMQINLGNFESIET